MSNDTDRIIAAHREESRKTRVLLAWLLLGIPLVAGLVWAGIALGAAHNSAAAQPTAADQAVTYDTAPLDDDPGSSPPTEDPYAAAKFTAALKTAHAGGKLSSAVYDWAVRYPQAMMSIGAGSCLGGPGDDSAEATAGAQSEVEMLFKQQDVPASRKDIATVAAISLATCPP